MNETKQRIKPSIFIGYAHEDEECAKTIRDWINKTLLEAFNISMASDISPGDKWREKINKALSDSTIGLILLTPNSIDRPWIYFEAGAMDLRGIKLIPVCLYGIEINDIEEPLKPRQAVILLGKENEEKLIKAIGKLRGLFPSYISDLNLPPFKRSSKPRRGRIIDYSSELDDYMREKIFHFYKVHGLIFNPSDARRNVSFKVETFNHLIESICNNITEGYEDILYKSGISCGEKFGKALHDIFIRKSEQLSIEKKISIWCDFDSEVGLGRFSPKINVDEKKVEVSGEIILANNFLVYQRCERNLKLCSFMRGYIKGVLEAIIHIPIEVTHNEDDCEQFSRIKTGCVFNVNSANDKNVQKN